MPVLDLTPGSLVSYRDQNWRIVATFGTERACIDAADGRQKTMALIAELQLPIKAKEPSRQLPLLFEDSPERAEAERWMECIRPLRNRADRTKEATQKRAAEFNLHAATVYRRLAAWDLHGCLEALVPQKSNGGRGKSRLRSDVEELTTSTIESRFLNSQRLTVKDVWMEVRRACELAGLPTPHLNTVAKRIHSLSAEAVTRRRRGRKAAERFQPRPNKFEGATYPLSIVEIDHTKLDVMLVDDVDRLPIGRAWITLAIDVFSRMVTGFYISLDPVGAISTGLCVAHSMIRKEQWLLEHGIEGEWPCWGRMDCIHVDNAKEFRGDMLRLACERYGIELNFRPVGQPHFGGHIERFMSTMAAQIHKLPGTTFSNVPDRGEYRSEAKACFTVGELETFVGKWIVELYHKSLHRGIQTSPLKKYRDGFSGQHGRPLPPVIVDTDRLQKDFMPVVYRTIQRTGVEIEMVHYYSPELQKWIGFREAGKTRSRRFSFARDPRDISRIYFLDPDDNEYREIPYLDSSRGPISIWELRKANEKLKEEGRRGINEHLLFEKHLELSEQARTNLKKTKAARRRLQKERKRAATPLIQVEESTEDAGFPPESVEPFDDSPVLPFEVEKL
jgi:putative transposase